MPLDADYKELVDTAGTSAEALSTVAFGLCWPNSSPFADHLSLCLLNTESLQDAAERLDLSWSPQWLTEAGYVALDSAGSAVPISGLSATSEGAISWVPQPRLCRVDGANQVT